MSNEISLEQFFLFFRSNKLQTLQCTFWNGTKYRLSKKVRNIYRWLNNKKTVINKIMSVIFSLVTVHFQYGKSLLHRSARTLISIIWGFLCCCETIIETEEMCFWWCDKKKGNYELVMDLLRGKVFANQWVYCLRVSASL